MTKDKVNLIGWAMIAGAILLGIVLDRFRFHYLHFNWFVLITIFVCIVLVIGLWWLTRMEAKSDPARSESQRT